ncbi:MAG: GNAT family N-acetyltransferase [Anaerolineales bacterium]|nr:GNAT family N-acetyltransferase [Anaerolineales bacterium]
MIVGKGIRLRAIERDDLPTLVTWMNDPDVRDNLAAYLPMSMADEERWFERLPERPREQQPWAIDIQRGSSWKLIGSCGFHDVAWRERSSEIGIMIGAKREWNKGYGTQAVALLVKFGFETLNLHRISLHVYEDNARAIRAYEKVGFVLEGRLRDAQYSDGVYKDVLQMSILRPEWDAAQGQNRGERAE